MFSLPARDIFMREFLAVMFETSKLTPILRIPDTIFYIDNSTKTIRVIRVPKINKTTINSKINYPHVLLI